MKTTFIFIQNLNNRVYDFIMTNDKLASEIRRRLKSSPVNKLLSETYHSIFPELPPGTTAEEFNRVFSNILMEELSSGLRDEDKEKVIHRGELEEISDKTIPDFELLYDKILREVQYGFTENSLQMLNALGSAVAARDTGNSDHNYRVTLYCVRFAEELKLTEKRIQSLIKGSFLHDIGKISINDTTLLKKSSLSDSEFRTMRNHVRMGLDIIKNVRWLEDAKDVVLYHHERWDGSGYLAGLKGNTIPLNARIFTIVDVFDALTSERPYKTAVTPHEAIKQLENEKGTHFDPGLVDTFAIIGVEIFQNVVGKDRESLVKLLTGVMDKYFGVSPTDPGLRSRFNNL